MSKRLLLLKKLDGFPIIRSHFLCIHYAMKVPYLLICFKTTSNTTREEEGDGEEEGAGGDGSDDSEADEPPVGDG